MSTKSQEVVTNAGASIGTGEGRRFAGGSQRLFCDSGWTDGLPIVLRLRAGPEDAGGHHAGCWEVIGIVPPRNAELRVEDAAINAVMAGCRPDYMPVIIAAMEAMLETKFNLLGCRPHASVCSTRDPERPLAKELDVNSGSGCFGPGWRANATIGRQLGSSSGMWWRCSGQGDMSTTADHPSTATA